MTQNQFNKAFPKFIDELKDTGDPKLALALTGITERDLAFYVDKATKSDPDDPEKTVNPLKAQILMARAHAIKYLLSQIKHHSNADFKAAVEYLKLLGYNRDKEEDKKQVQIVINSPTAKIEEITEQRQLT